MNRVASSSGRIAETFSYDAYGNRTDAAVPAADVNNRLNSSGFVTDAAGNVISTPTNSAYHSTAHSFTYFATGELKSVTDMGYNYTYDAHDRRFESSWAGAERHFFYAGDSDRVIAELPYQTGETCWADYVWLGGERIARLCNAVPNYYFTDHLGSTARMTDQNGNDLWGNARAYTAFGMDDPAYVAPTERRRFTGKERDSESGLDFMEARYYGSSMGRFVSPDPMGGHKEDPQTLNRYTYVRNNPLTLTDPTGLDFNLQCTQTKDNASTCQGGVVGTTDDKGKFTATVVTSASLQDDKSGNTATVNENGVQITTGGQTYQGQFIRNTPAADIAGSGKLQDFNFHIDGNCGGSCLTSGEWSYHGSLNDARALLGERGSFTIPFEDMRAGFGAGAHPFSTQHRFGGPDCSFLSCPNSPHLSVAYDPGTSNYVAAVKQEPKANVPQSSTGGFHVDAHADWLGHAKDVSSNPH